ncbi:MAG: hypothetical protein K2W92_07575 [Alphaproteobacteria bacterium]|nr:hypothetical protein [Alphaproteobacteria bacterium]
MKKLFFLFSLLFSFSAFANEDIFISVWNSAFDGGDHYGHVSLRTPRSYVSLWPSDNKRADLPVGCIAAQARFNRDYADDVRDEDEREADAIYKITLPSTQVIDDRWNELSSQNLIWFAFGNNSVNALQPVLSQLHFQPELREPFINLLRSPLTFNCASIVNHLLERGNVNLKDFLFIGSKHHPILQATFISLYTRGHADVLAVSTILDNFIYPDKVGYMVKRKMVDQVTRAANVPLDRFDYYLGDDDVDQLYRMASVEPINYNTIRDHTLEIKRKRDASLCSIQ